MTKPEHQAIELEHCYLPRQVCKRCGVIHLQEPFRLDKAVTDGAQRLRDAIDADMLESVLKGLNNRATKPPEKQE